MEEPLKFIIGDDFMKKSKRKESKCSKETCKVEPVRIPIVRPNFPIKYLEYGSDYRIIKSDKSDKIQ